MTTHRERMNDETDGLRFRFRATSLPKSPSAERFVSRQIGNNNNEEDDDENNVALATYVEPPELSTKTTHKVFGAFISLLSFLSDFETRLLPTHRHSRAHIYKYIYIFDATQNTDTTTSLLLPSFSTLFIKRRTTEYRMRKK